MSETPITPIKNDLLACGVERLGIFGSYSRGEQTPESDVDVLIKFKPEQKTYDNFDRVYDLLADLFNRKIDLVTEESLSPYFAHEIKRTVQYVSLA